MSKKIYLASPYGFSPQQEERLLPTFVGILSELGADVLARAVGTLEIGCYDKGSTPYRTKRT